VRQKTKGLLVSVSVVFSLFIGVSLFLFNGEYVNKAEARICECSNNSDCPGGWCGSDCQCRYAHNTPTPAPRPTNTPPPDPYPCSRNEWGSCINGTRYCNTVSKPACSGGGCGCYSNGCNNGASRSCGSAPTNTPRPPTATPTLPVQGCDPIDHPCSNGQECVNNKCEDPSASCGNHDCEAGESYTSCPEDCDPDNSNFELCGQITCDDGSNGYIECQPNCGDPNRACWPDCGGSSGGGGGYCRPGHANEDCSGPADCGGGVTGTWLGRRMAHPAGERERWTEEGSEGGFAIRRV